MTKHAPPTVGVTCIQIQSEEAHRPPRFGQNQTYIQALVRAGAAPLLFPQLDDMALLRAMYDRVDALLLPGGEDIDPAYYRQTVQEWCGPIEPVRDAMELTLARWATSKGKPLLAICRGIQVLNVALGGSLYQDIPAEVPGAARHAWYPNYPRDYLPHQASIRSGTRLAHIMGTTSLPINSLHHQAIKDLAEGLTVTARTPDQIIEAVEMEDHPFAIAVQWHPEELAANDSRAQALFDALIRVAQG